MRIVELLLLAENITPFLGKVRGNIELRLFRQNGLLYYFLDILADILLRQGIYG